MKRVALVVLLLALMGGIAWYVIRAMTPVIVVSDIDSIWHSTAPPPKWAEVSPEQVAEAKKPGVPVAFENDLGMRFVLIPAGTFWMIEAGTPVIEGPPPWEGRVERSRHEATIAKPFYMQTTEVTNSQFRRWKTAHDSGTDDERSLNEDRQPVVLVSWRDATAFAAWLSKNGRRRAYRLPSGTEWERSARGGREGLTYPWGNSDDVTRRNSSIPDDGYVNSAPVAHFPPNRYGLYDMTANVAEWCGGPWKPRTPRGIDLGFSVRMRGDLTEMTVEEAANRDRRRAEEAKLPHHAVRGGSWMMPCNGCATRSDLPEGCVKVMVGFRLVSPLPER